MKIEYAETEGFKKDFKRLLKKFRTLVDDLENAKQGAIELFHLKKIDNESCFEIKGFENDGCRIYKLKKFACKSMKGKGIKSGIRVIYAFCKSKKKVCLIEIYYKGIKEDEDGERIKKFISECKECFEHF